MGFGFINAANFEARGILLIPPSPTTAARQRPQVAKRRTVTIYTVFCKGRDCNLRRRTIRVPTYLMYPNGYCPECHVPDDACNQYLMDTPIP